MLLGAGLCPRSMATLYTCKDDREWTVKEFESSRWGREELDMIERLHFYALEKEMATHSCSCLENPRDGGAWWAAVYGVTQNQTRLKRLVAAACF